MVKRFVLAGAVVAVVLAVADIVVQVRANQAASQGARGGQGQAPTPPCGSSVASDMKNVARDSRCFELRTYTVREGSSIDVLHTRFREHTTALFRKHGMTIVGFWQPVAKPDTLVYLLAYKDNAARDAAWAAFAADPEWVRARTALPVSLQVEAVFMNATDYGLLK
jgi:hypothetical protein